MPDADTYGRILHLVIEQIIGNTRRLVKYWALSKVLSRGGEQGDNVVLASSTVDKYLGLTAHGL